MKRLFLTIYILCILIPIPLAAQFYSAGDNPASVRWDQFETEHFSIVYARHADSLAHEYARQLEKWYRPVSLSVGFAADEMTGVRMPVVLHSYNNAYANGSVAWAPKRMDLFTSPDIYEPTPLPWMTNLAIHEQRHSAQMQIGVTGAIRPFYWFFGEMFNGLASMLYPGSQFLEGDAVVAETALTRSGRGRTADFLNYYMIAFDKGDMRTWERWACGSHKFYTPLDKDYSLGYMTIAGVRYLYDTPYYTDEILHYGARRPYDFFFNWDTVTKNISGKSFHPTMEDVLDGWRNLWKTEIEARAPYTPYSQIVRTPRFHTVYGGNIKVGNYVYSVKSGLAQPPVLVRISDSGKERSLAAFPSMASDLKAHKDGKLYWSETVMDPRWSLKSRSVIRYYDTADSRKHTVRGKYSLFNPHPTDRDGRITASEITMQGKSYVVLADVGKGRVIERHALPDSLQVIESHKSEDMIYVTALSDNGYGIYVLDKGKWTCILGPQPVKITELDVYDSTTLSFVSDRTGVNELYRFYTDSGKTVQLTSSRYGGRDFTCNASGDSLFFSLMEYDGNLLCSVPTDSLFHREVDFNDIHKYIIADRLSEQEQVLDSCFRSNGAGGCYGQNSTSFTKATRAEIKAMKSFKAKNMASGKLYQPLPKKAERHPRLQSCHPALDAGSADTLASRKFRKGLDLFGFHSWAPVYFDVDNLMAMSFDNIYEAVSLGVAAVSQNRLGTAASRIGYSAHKDPYNPSAWRHSGHFKFTYSGWYPVIEASVDVNDRAARESYMGVTVTDLGNTGSLSFGSQATPKPYVRGRITAYIPFNFSSGGWLRGFVPRISYTISNDIINSGPKYIFEYTDGFNAGGQMPAVVHKSGKRSVRQQLNVSARFYSMRPVTNSGVYPRLGIGIEGGVATEPEAIDIISPMGYFYGYGYLPGIMQEHGIRLSILCQTSLRKKSIFSFPAANTLPRGFNSSSGAGTMISLYGTSCKMTADYAIPFAFGDISLGGSILYIKRFILTPHFDYTFFSTSADYLNRTGRLSGGLFSAGGTFAIDFGAIIGLRIPFSAGVTYSYNGGPSFNSFKASGLPLSRHFVGPVFDISF